MRGEGPAYLNYRSHQTYALAITAGDASDSPISPFSEDLKICTGSYNDAGRNKLEVLGVNPELIANPELYAQSYYNDEDDSEDQQGLGVEASKLSRQPGLVCLARRSVDFPPTKVAFGPAAALPCGTFEHDPETVKHFVATSGDALRIYAYHDTIEKDERHGQHVGDNAGKRKGKLTKDIKYPERAESGADLIPVTSFDWCTANTAHIVTSSTDGQCSVWDVPKQSQIAITTIVVDAVREVFDVTWSPGCRQTFVAATGNGTIHCVDTRAVGQTTILYKGSPPTTSPSSAGCKELDAGSDNMGIARVAFDPENPHLLATLQLNSNTVRILDTRNPGVFIAALDGHAGDVNGIAWRGLSATDQAEGTRGPSLATVSDDCQVLLWDPNQIDTQAHMVTSVKGKGRVWRGRPSAFCTLPDPIENVAWGVDNDYLAVTMGSRVRCLRL